MCSHHRAMSLGDLRRLLSMHWNCAALRIKRFVFLLLKKNIRHQQLLLSTRLIPMASGVLTAFEVKKKKKNWEIFFFLMKKKNLFFLFFFIRII